ncbi:MAG: alpha-glucosidase [Myxococcales bacterium]
MRDLLRAKAPVAAAAVLLLPIGCSRDSKEEATRSGQFELGTFRVEVGTDASLRVSHASLPERVIFSTPGHFVQAWSASESLEEQNGSVTLNEQVDERCDEQGELSISREGDGLRIATSLDCKGGTIPVMLRFAPLGDRALGFTLSIAPPSGSPFNQVVLTPESVAGERFVGFGEQFSYVNLRGQAMPIVVQEGGIGRAPGTVRDQVEAFAPGTGGSFFSTYAPMPYYFTDRGRSLLLENSEVSFFDLSGTDTVSVRLAGLDMRGRLLFGKTPGDIVAALSDYTGRMQSLPDWIQRGAIVGMQGGTQRVREVQAQLAALDTPVAAFWLQDWVGKRDTPLGSRLWWNWQLNQTQYPDFAPLVSDLAAANVHVLTYVNPYLVDVAGDPAFTRNLYAEARERGYLVKDRAGNPYVHVSGTFQAGVVDLTNPAAVRWLQDVIRDELLAVGATGYMADFGEGLAFDAVLASGEAPTLMHNRWPELWAQLNHDLLQEQGKLGDVVFFTRSGFTRSPSWSSLFWTGDQMVDWDANDGMASSLTGLLSSGLSGVSLNHTDIGGYTAFGGVKRSEELLLRWIEWSAFTTLFRTHEGNAPADNAQIYSNARTLEHFSKFAKLYAALAPYRKQLMQDAQATGAPLVRHLLLEYPDDPRAWDAGTEFMLGPDVLVAPVFAPGATRVSLYLPAGSWVQLYTGKTFATPGDIEVEAPLGQPAVFYRAGSNVGQTLEAAAAP